MLSFRPQGEILIVFFLHILAIRFLVANAPRNDRGFISSFSAEGTNFPDIDLIPEGGDNRLLLFPGKAEADTAVGADVLGYGDEFDGKPRRFQQFFRFHGMGDTMEQNNITVFRLVHIRLAILIIIFTVR